MTDTSPNWVLLEAVKRCGWTYNDILELQSYYDNDPRFSAVCDMILKHEQPPMGRKTICAQQAASEWDNSLVLPPIDVAVRAIELWEEGFGK